MFRPNEWSGRGFTFFWKHMVTKYPQMVAWVPFYVFVAPVIIYASAHREKPFWAYHGHENLTYRVLRSDDPLVKNLVTLDQEGNVIRYSEK